MGREMKIFTVLIQKPKDLNLIFGQSHFIKTVEDIHEVLVNAVPNIKFGLAFCESSGPCLVRSTGTDRKLVKLAEKNALAIGAGHAFIILLKDAYPINVLNAIKSVPEVCHIFCATANSVEVVIAEVKQGRAILGVVDGSAPKGVEKARDKEERKKFLRQVGYKM
jgi:adenosine/AMP kinase